MKTTKRLCCAMACFVFAIGCGGLTITDEDGKKVKISKNGNQITVDSEDGSAVMSADDQKVSIKSQNGDGSTVLESGEGATLPKAFPSDIPIYPDSTIIVSVDNKTANRQNFTVTLQTDAAIEDVASHYQSNFESSDWSISDQNTIDSSGQKYISMVATKEDVKCTTMIVGKSDEKVTINLVVEVTLNE